MPETRVPETRVTVLADEAATVPATIDDERVVVAPDRLPAALGWELKPEGLCRDDVCVPVRDPDALRADDGLDLVAVATALDRPAVVDASAAVVAVGRPAHERRRATEQLTAAPFTLPDLDGGHRTLEEFRGRKKLLLAFASW